MNKENFNTFTELASSENYSECVYSAMNKNGKFDVYIKSCCNNLIVDLLKNGFNVEMCGNRGLLVYKFD